MKRIFNALFFYFVGIISKNSTLANKTWHKIARSNPALYVIKKEQDNYLFKVKINNFKPQLFFVLFVNVVGFCLCFIPETITEHYFHWLTIVKLPEKQDAYSLVSETMGAAAPIIGLSFVVIGFLFETVRNKTQRTFEDLFRATQLYFVFAVTVINMVVLIILDAYKYSVEPYTAGNFAILGCLLLIGIMMSISYLFYKVIKFFSPEKIAELSKGRLLKSAKYFLLNEQFVKESKIVFNATFEEYGFSEQQWSFFDAAPTTLVRVGNTADVILVDVFLPLLNFWVQRIKKRSNSGSFYSLHCLQHLEEGKPVFSFADGTTIKQWEQRLIALTFNLRPIMTQEDEFMAEKQKMENRLKVGAELGDIEILTQTLTDMKDLYEIFYKGIK